MKVKCQECGFLTGQGIVKAEMRTESLSKKKRVLILHLKRIWFEQIKSGVKAFEYRAASEYWRKRLVGREYDEVHLMLGYPSGNDAERIIRWKFNGVFPAVVSNHPEFGDGDVPVFAIDVSCRCTQSVANV